MHPLAGDLQAQRMFQQRAITCLCTIHSATGHVEKPDGLFPFVASFTERGQAQPYFLCQVPFQDAALLK